MHYSSLLGLDPDSPVVEMFLKEFKGEKIWSQDQELNERFCTIAGAGIELLFDASGKLCTIFFFFGGSPDYMRFQGPLPEDLRISMSQRQVRDKLGQPNESGGGITFLKESISPWDKFLREEYALHIAYSNNLDSIAQVSISASGGSG